MYFIAGLNYRVTKVFAEDFNKNVIVRVARG